MQASDGATEWETAGRIVRLHETGRCPQCDGGGCWLLDWATTVRTDKATSSDTSVRGTGGNR